MLCGDITGSHNSFLQTYVYMPGYKHSLDLLVVTYVVHCKNKSLITLVSCEIWRDISLAFGW